MKLADIKGDVAVKIRILLLTKFEEYINEFILTLPESYKSTIEINNEQCYGKTLFDSNRGIINLLSTKEGEIEKGWYKYIKNWDLAKALGIVGYDKEVTKQFNFENRYFSGSIVFSSYVYRARTFKGCEKMLIHHADIDLKIKDKDTLMKELDQELKYKKPVPDNASPIEIKKRKEIRSLVDQIFKEFSTPEDNMIALWAINNGLRWDEDEEKKVYHLCPHEINYKRYLKTAKKRNPFYYPIGTGTSDRKVLPWKEDTIPERYRELIEKLRGLCLSIGIKDAESYYNDYGINAYWAGVVGITKDYKVISYVIRHDGVLAAKRSMNYDDLDILKDTRGFFCLKNNRGFNKILTTI